MTIGAPAQEPSSQKPVASSQQKGQVTRVKSQVSTAYAMTIGQ